MIIKSKLAKVIYQTVYVVLGVIGIIGSLGYFSGSFNTNFYAYYTNLSNYICWGMMLVGLILSVKNFATTDRPQSYAPKFKFMCVIMILVTCLVYNILLAKDSTPAEYFLSLSNLLNHVILPIMFILDWVLFYEHGQTKWYYPLLCVIMPLIYVVFILIRAAILQGVDGAMLYPYFFLNVEKLGVGMFIVWVAALVAIFVAIGYALVGLDHVKKSCSK